MLRTAEDAAIRDVVAFQERLGFKVVTDGEFRRENWWLDFISRIGGTSIETGAGPSFTSSTDHDFQYVPMNVLTVGKLTRPVPLATDDFAALHAMTNRVAKITLPSPSRMHFHGGRRVVSREAYPEIASFFVDVAKIYQEEIAALETAGCRYIQIDDPLLTYFISDRMRAEIVADGETPEKRLELYVDLINACIRNRRPETRVGIHLCRGNSRSGWLTEGGYERIAEATLGRLAVDTFFLEYDDARSGDFRPLRFVPPTKTVVLGLVTTKFATMEDKAALRSRIEEAAAFVDLDRLAISPQCGFASTIEGNLITPEVQEAKLRLVVDTAREVWGTA
jgi:5-methyltetrahydropteroyltriglutamate--homocysteine methyltransferase